VVHTDIGKVISSLNNRLLPIQSAFSKISVERCASAWLKHIAFLKTDFPLETQGENNIFKPYGALLETAKKIDKEAVIATDVGQHQMWAAQVFPFYKPRQWLTSGGLGTMGFGLPAAIGASLV
jgi:acetolactate synthase-1/2/3 large subunit